MIEIKDKSLCSGCHACFNVCPKECIEMKSDNEGFWYPEVDKNKCVDCHLCEKACPIINLKESNNNPKAYACYNKDENIRMDSSSGGLFTLLASKTINNGGVVYGAMFNEQFEVIHGKVSTNDELKLFRGAKYTQSKLGDTYKNVKQDLDKGTEVYFSGTPCQIDGLLTYLNKKYDNLICQDIICHGVPSPKVWKEYLKTFKGNINKVKFRNKEDGWTGYKVEIESNEQSYMNHHSNDIYMKAFLSNICLRPSCYNCHSKSLHRNSDITLADFWGINNIDSSMNDNKGTSLVFIDSKKGQELYDSLEENIVFREVDINEAVKYNPSAYQSVALTDKRKQFFNNYNGENLNEVVKELTKVSLLKKISKFVYRVIRKLRRMILNDK